MKQLLLHLLPITLIILSSCHNTTDTSKTSPIVHTTPLRIACVGNSITEGYGLEDPETEAYPARLQEILGSDYQVLNCGISSHTAMQKTDFPYMKPVHPTRDPFHDALAFQPDIVTIKLGTNDSKTRYDSLMHADFTHDLCALIDSFEVLSTHPKIFLCLPVPATAQRWGIRDSVIRTEIIPRIQAIAEERNLPIIDLYKPMLPFPELLADDIHPNRAGAMLIAEEIARNLITQQ